LKFLYQSHPAENILQSVIPANLWNARINVLPIPYSDLKSIRSVIRRLVKFINGSEPDLVLFFATGSLPYVLPAINMLGVTQGEVLLERTVFHMFPGLAWSGRIDGHSSEDFFISEVLLLLQQIHSSSKIPKILCVDTTNTGNAVNKVLKAMRGVCNRFPRELEVNVIGIVNGADAIATANDQISIEYGEASIAHVIRPGEIVLPDRVRTYDFSELHWIPERNSSRFFLSYWVLDRLLTEDKAALVGATSIHERLAVGPDSSAGRLLITFDNGTSMHVASMGTVGKQLSGLLILKEDSPLWGQFDEHSRIPPADRSPDGDLEDLRTEALQSFEIDEDVSALAGIMAKKVGLLTAAEIWALAEARYFDARTRSMVRAAQGKAEPRSLVHEAGQIYFQVLGQFCYDCCHEAGHATARYLNGDTLLSISVFYPEDLSSKPHLVERGCVLFRHQQWQCGCGGLVRDGVQENESYFKFTPGCLSCESYVTRLLAGTFAGGSATRLLEPQNHQDRDSEFDYNTANTVVINAVEASHRDTVMQDAQRVAFEMVNQHSEVIIRLKDALVSAYGFLDGERATELLSGLEAYVISRDASS
jgi:hypothetical protein